MHIFFGAQGQLFQLMKRLENTTPHFIRCIKPNNNQSSGLYDQGLVLQQLKCCGVLEVVRISRSGFPTRMSHKKFARRCGQFVFVELPTWYVLAISWVPFSPFWWDYLIRYGFLLLESVASQDPLSVSVSILHQFGILPEMYHIGYTKLFFRMGQVDMFSTVVFYSTI